MRNFIGKKWIGVLTALLVPSFVFGLNAYNAGLLLGAVDSIKCSTGTTCTKTGKQVVITATSPSFTLENNEFLNNTVDDTIEVGSEDNNTTFQITGFEAKNAILNLYADQGDDAADKFSIKADTSDVLHIMNNTTELLQFSSAGVMTLADNETITNASDVVEIGADDADANLSLKAFEAKDAILTLKADEADDNGDTWQVLADHTTNSLILKNDTSGSQVAKFTLTTGGALSSVASITGPGTGNISGFLKPLVLASATTITAAQCGAVFYNAGAVQMELPEASTVPGCVLTFVTLNASNFDINPDNGDQITVLTNGVGDAIRNATVGNNVILMAVSASQWIELGTATGTWSDIN